MGRAHAIGGALAGLLAFASGCQFDPSQRGGLDVGPDGDVDPDDADPCPAELVARITVNGVDAPLFEDGPYAHVLLGDTVELSADSSCSQGGELSVSWRIEPQATQVEGTADPGLDATTITVHPLRPESYIARLTVSDGTGTASAAVFAFQAHGFRQLAHLPGGAAGQVADLSAGETHLWIGTGAGAYRADLAAPNVGPYPSVQDLSGDELKASIAAVFEDESGAAWFGRRDSDDVVWRLEGSGLREVGIGASARVRDIGAAPGGVRLAADRGVFARVGSGDFERERDEDSHAIALVAGAGYGGGDRLYPLPDGDPLDVFGPGNNKIRALASAGDALWVGSDDQGLARFSGGATTDRFTVDDSLLPSNQVRAIAVEASGDVWVATTEGLARYKADRGVWVPLGRAAGIAQTDLSAVAAAGEGSARTIFVGGVGGLYGMQIRATP